MECPSRSPTWRAISLCIGSRHAEQADYRQVTRLVGSPLGTSQPERQLTPPAVAARVQLVRFPLGTPGDSNQRGGPAARRRIVRARRGAQDRRVDHRPVPRTRTNPALYRRPLDSTPQDVVVDQVFRILHAEALVTAGSGCVPKSPSEPAPLSPHFIISREVPRGVPQTPPSGTPSSRRRCRQIRSILVRKSGRPARGFGDGC